MQKQYRLLTLRIPINVPLWFQKLYFLLLKNALKIRTAHIFVIFHSVNVALLCHIPCKCIVYRVAGPDLFLSLRVFGVRNWYTKRQSINIEIILIQKRTCFNLVHHGARTGVIVCVQLWPPILSARNILNNRLFRVSQHSPLVKEDFMATRDLMGFASSRQAAAMPLGANLGARGKLQRSYHLVPHSTLPCHQPPYRSVIYPTATVL